LVAQLDPLHQSLLMQSPSAPQLCLQDDPSAHIKSPVQGAGAPRAGQLVVVPPHLAIENMFVDMHDVLQTVPIGDGVHTPLVQPPAVQVLALVAQKLFGSPLATLVHMPSVEPNLHDLQPPHDVELQQTILTVSHMLDWQSALALHGCPF
jgi:hypothetical protein